MLLLLLQERRVYGTDTIGIGADVAIAGVEHALTGLSPERKPAALAQLSTVPIRWPTRRAVSGFVSQIGASARSTSGVPI